MRVLTGPKYTKKNRTDQMLLGMLGEQTENNSRELSCPDENIRLLLVTVMLNTESQEKQIPIWFF